MNVSSCLGEGEGDDVETSAPFRGRHGERRAVMVVVLIEEEHGRLKWDSLHHRHDGGDWDDRSPGGCTHGIPPEVPAKLDPRPLATALRPILAGTPADVSTAAVGTPSTVIWVDGGHEVVAHLDSLTARVLDGAVIFWMDLESDQTGRAPVLVRFAVPGGTDDAGLVVATDEVAGGHPLLAARWGAAVQDAAWSALLTLAQEHASASGQAPAGISAVAGALRLHLEAPVNLTAPVTA